MYKPDIALAAGLDFMTMAYLVVTPERRAVWANAPAESLLQRPDGIGLESGHLQCADSPAHARLTTLVAAATKPRSAPTCGTMTVPRPSGWLHYQVLVLPIGEHASERRVGVFINDPVRELDDVTPCLQSMYALTAAEAAVAAKLASGSDVTQIARDRECSRETVRVLLKRVFDKMGARRQVDVVRLVLGIASTCCGQSLSAPARSYVVRRSGAE